MTVKYFEDFDVTPAKMMSDVRIHSVTPGQCINFRYQKESDTFSQKDDEYTLYVTNVDSHTISGWCKERNDFRKFKRDNLTSMIYTKEHFLTNKPKGQTVNKEFPLIAGLSVTENLEIAKMRHPDKKWEVRDGKVQVKQKQVKIVSDSNAVRITIDGGSFLILRESSQSVNGYHVSNQKQLIKELQDVIKTLSE